MLELTYRLQTFRDYSYSNRYLVKSEATLQSILRRPYVHFWLNNYNFNVSGPISIFLSSLTRKFDWDSKSDILLSLKWLSGPQKSNFLIYWPIWKIFFFFDLEIWLGFQIRYWSLPDWTTKVCNNDSLRLILIWHDIL